MIKREIEKKVTGNTLSLCSTEKEDNYETRMFFENRPEGFLDCMIRYQNGEEYYVYDITGMESLSDHFEHRSIGIKDLINIFNDLSKAFYVLSEYMLGQEHLRIEPENIFYDISEKKCLMCFYPREKRELSDTMEELSDFLIQKTDHKDEEAIKYAYEFYKNIATGNYSIPGIRQEKKLSGSVFSNEKKPLEISGETLSKGCEEEYADNIKTKNKRSKKRSSAISVIISSVVLTAFIVLFLSALIYAPYRLTRMLERTEVLVAITLTATLFSVIPVLKRN